MACAPALQTEAHRAGSQELGRCRNFFNAPSGKTDPEAELEATLASFFVIEDEQGDEHAQCRLIARYAWFKEVLDFDANRLTEQRCARSERWLSTLNPERVSLVFAAAYLNNPASMFGHTLLRVDAKGQKGGTRLLATAVNFVALAHAERRLELCDQRRIRRLSRPFLGRSLLP
jgi:hypothetical protein